MIDIELEVKHIFESGANEIRVVELIKNLSMKMRTNNYRLEAENKKLRKEVSELNSVWNTMIDEKLKLKEENKKLDGEVKEYKKKMIGVCANLPLSHHHSLAEHNIDLKDLAQGKMMIDGVLFLSEKIYLSAVKGRVLFREALRSSRLKLKESVRVPRELSDKIKTVLDSLKFQGMQKPNAIILEDVLKRFTTEIKESDQDEV